MWTLFVDAMDDILRLAVLVKSSGSVLLEEHLSPILSSDFHLVACVDARVRTVSSC